MTTGKQRKSLQINTTACNGCGACIKACPTRAIAFSGNSLYINHHYCQNCHECILACDRNCIEPFQSLTLTRCKCGILYTQKHPFAIKCSSCKKTGRKEKIKQWHRENPDYMRMYMRDRRALSA